VQQSQTLTPDELKGARESLLARAGMPEQELRTRAADWALTRSLRGILSEVDGLDYLIQRARG
jgi:hypothetical protein